MLWKLSVYKIHPPIVHVGITFQPSRPHSSWERCDKNILMFENWREKKWKQVAQRATVAHLSPMCQGQILFKKKSGDTDVLDAQGQLTP